MDPDEREWFWNMLDGLAADAERRSAQAAAWETLKTELSLPFVRILERLTAWRGWR